MTIGNIIIEKDIKLLNVEKFISVTSELPKTVDVPTLIIGWELVKKLFPNQSILDKQISDKIKWTFGKKEKRVDYDRDINNFYKSLLTNIENNQLEYHFFNIFKLKYNNYKGLINLLKSNLVKHIYVHFNSFIYLYYNKYVIGISIDDLEFMGVSKNKTLKLLYSNQNNKVFYNTDFISKDIKKITNHNRIMIPYLHSILNVE